MVKNAICRFCKIPFTYERKPGKDQVFCNKECAKSANQKRQVARRRECNLQARLGLSSGAIGQINEMVVSIDLIKRGWAVYRAFEPTHPFDILAIRGDIQLKIEVKTEIVLPSGFRYVSMKKGQGAKHDILAKVHSLGEKITYVPELPT